jgi:soluble lytic murein transglycosylase
MTADMRAWRVRAALAAKAWRDVLAAIDALPRATADEATWRYWRARALAATGRGDEARAIYAALAVEHDYHGLLAAETLGMLRRSRRASRSAPTPAWQAGFAARDDVRARSSSRSSTCAPNRSASGSDRARLRRRRAQPGGDLRGVAGMNDRAINTANRTRERHDYALRYPTPYRAQFEAAARDVGVDEALLRGIARQESRFVPEIVSSAGAVGLMQLMPATARWVAKQSGRADYTPARINDLDVNTQFGAFYFKYWLDRLDGSVALAAAAYNAGPGRAQQWRPSEPLDGAIWVETIPFNETRDYVKKVIANSVYYARAFGDASVEARHAWASSRRVRDALAPAGTPIAAKD